MAETVEADGLTPQQRWRKNHPDEAKAFCLAWAKTPNGRAHRAANQRAYRQRHPEKVKASIAAWLGAHPTYEADRGKRRYADDPDRQTKATRRWEQKNPAKLKAIQSRAHSRRRARIYAVSIEVRLSDVDWREIVAKYDGRCAYCFALTSKPEKDHVLALVRGGHHVAANVVPACRGCNASKRTKLLMDWLFPERKAG